MEWAERLRGTHGKMMRTYHLFLIVGLLGIIGACGSEPACDGRRCENDPPAAQERIELCESGLSHPVCGPLFEDFFECLWRETSCDENGKADPSDWAL